MKSFDGEKTIKGLKDCMNSERFQKGIVEFRSAIEEILHQMVKFEKTFKGNAEAWRSSSRRGLTSR